MRRVRAPGVPAPPGTASAKQMKHDPTEQQDLSAAYADERGVGARAGVFLLEGRFHVASHHSRAERRLLEGGAMLVATLVFEPAEARRAVSGGSGRPYAFSAPPVPALAPLRPAQAVFALGSRPSPN
jgi:hypothetical protein